VGVSASSSSSSSSSTSANLTRQSSMGASGDGGAAFLRRLVQGTGPSL
jgi:hypothetical protein